jgi:acetyltransferase-like isoleucine patch superfamily enzyme
VGALAAHRASGVKSRALVAWMRLISKGPKGRRITVEDGFSLSPGSECSLGDDVHLGARVVFEISVNPAGAVSVGDRTWISRDCHVSCLQRIDVGSDVLIGEFVSLRDSTHIHTDITTPIKSQGDVVGQIRIDDDVWIGRGCLIQGRAGGVVIGQGAIVAANSVVRHSIPPREIWGGVPARFIKRR